MIVIVCIVVNTKLLFSSCNQPAQHWQLSVRMLAILVSLGLLRCLVEVNSQTFPYVSFKGQTLANHSFMDVSLVGYMKTGRDSVQCHTDLATCCTNKQSIHRGDWYFPNGNRLQFNSTYNYIHQIRELTYGV